MTLRAVIFLTLALLPAAALSQTMRVLSGEHAGFTRFVFPLPADTEWRVDKRGGAVEVRVLSGRVRYDVSRVFDRIPRTRVSGLRKIADHAGVALILACPCPASSFVEGERFLVVDIKDPPPPRRPRLPPTAFAQNIPGYRFAGLSAAPDTPDNTVGAHATGREPQRDTPLYRLPAVAPNTPRMQEAAVFDSLELWRRDLERRIAAAEQRMRLGAMLSGRTAAPGRNAPDRRPHDRPAVPVAFAEKDRRETVPAPPEPIGISDNFAIRAPGEAPPPAPTDPQEQKRPCLDPDLLDVASWSGQDDFSAAIEKALPALISETGDLSPEGARQLARTYLYFGLLEEATAVAGTIREEDPAAAAVLAMAAALRGEEAGAALLAGQWHCDSAAALWAMIAAPARGAELDTKAVLGEFSRLPPHLRRLLGPILSNRFRQAGKPSLAQLVTRRARAGDRDDISGIALADDTESDAAQAAGDRNPEPARLPRNGPGGAARALARLIERKLTEDAAVTEELAQLASSFAMEFRGSALEPDLLRAQALALALSGDFAAALKTAFPAWPDMSEPAVSDRTVDDVLLLMAERADDITFLELALPIDSTAAAPLPERSRAAIARRFLELGFARPAETLLGTG